jgi:hypothetical protein
MNWLILIPVFIAVAALIIFTIKKNQKDEKEFENQLNNDFPKSKDEEGDVDAEEVTK